MDRQWMYITILAQEKWLKAETVTILHLQLTCIQKFELIEVHLNV
jgi:hypothetical protein